MATIQPLRPTLTLEQLYPGDVPTGNHIVDAVVLCLKTYKFVNAQRAAELLGVDQNKLSGAIELTVGCPLSELLLYWRHRHMLHLLRHTDLTLEQVADQCGYSCTKSFITAFRNSFDVTPMSVRTGVIWNNELYNANRSSQNYQEAYARLQALIKAEDESAANTGKSS